MNGVSALERRNCTHVADDASLKLFQAHSSHGVPPGGAARLHNQDVHAPPTPNLSHPALVYPGIAGDFDFPVQEPILLE